jgi:hypothetical protein
MALYKYAKFFNLAEFHDFETEFRPGDRAPQSGLYRCCGCGDEIASNAGSSFPSPSHHPHTADEGTIRWRLIVSAQSQTRPA